MKNDIHIAIGAPFRRKVKRAWLTSIIEVALESEQIAGPVHAGLTITDQDGVRVLNRDYRGIDAPTDVLSFAMEEQKGTRKFAVPPDGPRVLGDVIVSYPQAAVQAAERGASVEQELALLVIHGILHLLGYDHQKQAEARAMEDKQAALLDQIFQL